MGSKCPGWPGIPLVAWEGSRQHMAFVFLQSGQVHLVQMAQCVNQGGGDKTPILTPSQNISAVPGNLPV